MVIARNNLTADYARSILDYDPETGVLTWRERPREHFKTYRQWKTWNARFVGTHAGSPNSRGYLQIRIDGASYQAHRIIWLHVKGVWPVNNIDHIDVDKLNNAFANLREATSAENILNRGLMQTNTSGYKGVCRRRNAGKWIAQIRLFGKSKYLGSFDKIEDAAAAYADAAREHHGEFARTA